MEGLAFSGGRAGSWAGDDGENRAGGAHLARRMGALRRWAQGGSDAQVRPRGAHLGPAQGG